MSNHTPGPWYIDADEPEAKGIPITNGAGFIADVGTLGPSDDEDRANARLVAAAPDLLAALEEVTTELFWMDHGPRDSDRKAFARRVEELRGLARAAIAKAKGGE